MKIEKMKELMIQYVDFYGGDLLGSDKIEKARTKRELAKIIHEHSAHMENMALDAESHLEKFKKEIELPYF